MPVIASIEDSNQSDGSTFLMAVDSSDCNDEIIRFDHGLSSRPPAHRSPTASSTSNLEDDSIIPCSESSSSSKLDPANNSDRKPACQSSSSTTQKADSDRSDTIHGLSLIKTIVRDQIEQHLRTLCISSTRQSQKRERSVDTSADPTKNLLSKRNQTSIEPEANVFDTLHSLSSSSSASDDSILPQNPSNAPHSLDSTIKKGFPQQPS